MKKVSIWIFQVFVSYLKCCLYRYRFKLPMICPRKKWLVVLTGESYGAPICILWLPNCRWLTERTYNSTSMQIVCLFVCLWRYSSWTTVLIFMEISKQVNSAVSGCNFGIWTCVGPKKENPIFRNTLSIFLFNCLFKCFEIRNVN